MPWRWNLQDMLTFYQAFVIRFCVLRPNSQQWNSLLGLALRARSHNIEPSALVAAVSKKKNKWGVFDKEYILNGNMNTN